MSARVVVVAASVLASSVASATVIIPNGAVGLEYVTGGVRFTDPGVAPWTQPGEMFQGRTWTQPSPNTIGVSEQYRIPLGGRQVPVSVGRTVGARAIGVAAARLLPVVGTGVLLWDLWNTLRVRPTGGVPGGQGIATDPGQTQETAAQYCTVAPKQGGGFQQVCGNNAQQAVEARLAYYENGWARETCAYNGVTNYKRYFVASVLSATSVNVKWECLAGPTGVTVDSGTFGASATNVQRCPGYIDPLNPALSVPAGTATVGSDGKCPTGRYTVPLTPDQAADMWAAHPPTSQQLEDAAKDILTRGEPIDGASPMQVSGQPTATGQPSTTTTTRPDGSTATTTTSPTYNYTFNGDTVTYNITNTTTTVVHNTDGSTSTETTTDAPSTEVDPEDPCAKEPDRVGCTKLGTPPTDAPQWETQNIPFEAENLGFGGSCPAPYSFTLPTSHLTMMVNWQPACDVAPGIRAALLAMTAVGCILFVLGATRS